MAKPQLPSIKELEAMIPTKREVLGPMGGKKGAIRTDRVFPAAMVRELLKRVHEKIEKAEIPEEDRPSTDAILRRVLGWVDEGKINEWVQDLAERSLMEGRPWWDREK